MHPISLAVPVLLPAGSAGAQMEEARNLVILGTSDIRGNVRNYDYFTDSMPTGSAQRGLTKV